MPNIIAYPADGALARYRAIGMTADTVGDHG
jgi:hypothetical protein